MIGGEVVANEIVRIMEGEVLEETKKILFRKFAERRLVDGVEQVQHFYVDVGQAVAVCPGCGGSGFIPCGRVELDTEERDGKTLIKKAGLRPIPGLRSRYCGTCWSRGWVELDKEGRMIREMYSGERLAQEIAEADRKKRRR